MCKENIINNYFIKTKCPKCGNFTHEPITGKFTYNEEYLVQRHCSKCHYTDVTNHMNGYIREGIIKDNY